MSKATVFFISIVAGLISAAATYWLTSQADDGQPVIAEKPGDGDVQIRDIQERLEQLELQIKQSSVSVPESFILDTSEIAQAESGTTEPKPGNIRPPRPLRLSHEESRAQRLDRLVLAGFSAAEADEVLHLQSQERLEQMDRQYEGIRTAFTNNPDVARMMEPSSGIRNKLSESAYERYLEAYGLSTSMKIGGLIPGSPGELAGLQVRDEIIRYNDVRIYNSMDLQTATIKGEKGESVIITVRRNGSEIQLMIPRGPVGAVGSMPGPR